MEYVLTGANTTRRFLLYTRRTEDLILKFLRKALSGQRGRIEKKFDDTQVVKSMYKARWGGSQASSLFHRAKTRHKIESTRRRGQK